ncbi:MAG: hypothetical protein M3429_01805, partial [Verrucomicrobiota bacterium]|nr:hypothetical protein [Verrucomicrobiota bacterium]
VLVQDLQGGDEGAFASFYFVWMPKNEGAATELLCEIFAEIKGEVAAYDPAREVFTPDGHAGTEEGCHSFARGPARWHPPSPTRAPAMAMMHPSSHSTRVWDFARISIH